MCLTWYARVQLFASETSIQLFQLLILVFELFLKTFFFPHILKVDGLIRLMEGDNTGPINIGNPGYYTNPLSHKNRDYGA